MSISSFFNAKAPRAYRIAISMFFFIQGLTFSSWASRIPDIKAKFHLNYDGLGAVLLALPIGQLTGMALSGFLVTKFGSKTVLSIAVFLYPAALILLGLAPSTFLLTGALYIYGICGNLYNISVNTQAVGIEKLYGRSIIASFHGVWSLAGFTGAIIGFLMVKFHVDPRWHFCFMFLLCVCLMLTSRKHMLPRDAPTGAKRALFVKPDKAILTLGLIAFASMICEGTMFDWSNIYFQKVLNLENAFSRLGFVAFMSTMASGRFFADSLVTRFGIKRMLQAAGVVILSGLLLAVSLPYIVSATIGFLLVGLGVSSVVPLTYSLAGRSKTLSPGLALAAVSSIGFLGFLLGPPIIGFIAQASSLRGSFTLIAFLGLGTTLMAGRIKLNDFD